MSIYEFILEVIPWISIVIITYLLISPVHKYLGKIREKKIRVVLTKKNGEIITNVNGYVLLYGNVIKNYKINKSEVGILINLKKNQIILLTVLLENRTVGTKKINTGQSQLEFIEVDCGEEDHDGNI